MPADFIQARLTETEDAARAAAGYHWSWDRVGERFYVTGSAWDVAIVALGPPDGPDGYVSDKIGRQRANAMHIAAHDPNRVLRWCAALRAVVAELADHYLAHYDPTLRAIAAIWSDHPEYRKDWTLQ